MVYDVCRLQSTGPAVPVPPQPVQPAAQQAGDHPGGGHLLVPLHGSGCRGRERAEQKVPAAPQN